MVAGDIDNRPGFGNTAGAVHEDRFRQGSLAVDALGAAAVFLFFLASVVMLLMLVFQADTIEYGQWKLGQRNGAVNFALQPFINKVSGALNTAVVGLVAIVSGINDARTPADVSDGGRLLVRVTMLLVPAVLVALAYLVWRRKYVLDEATHSRIVADLDARGALRVDAAEDSRP